MSAPHHLLIPKHLEAHGISGYEPDTMACAAAILSTRPGDFYDIGANVGVFSIFVAGAMNRRAISFEPTPEIADVLKRAAAENALPITCQQKALSSESGTTTFYLSDRSDMSNSLNRAFRHSTRGIQVEVDTLDISLSGAPALLKIDTESTEPDVLEGAKETIARYRPAMIIEVLKGRTEDRLNTFFDTRGYHAYHITSKAQWKRCNEVTGDASHENNNWLFAPESLGEDFWVHLDAWRWRLR